MLAKVFCGNLGMIEVSVPTSGAASSSRDNDGALEEDAEQEESRDQFELLLDAGRTAQAHKEARDHDLAILKEIQGQFVIDRNAVTSNLTSYTDMCTKLIQDANQTATAPDRASRLKRKRASKTALRDFTTQTRKSKKGEDVIKGWSDKGKRYVVEMHEKITQDELSGNRKKWEDAYKKLRKMVQQTSDEREEEDDDEAPTLDMDVLYSQVGV